MIPAFEGLLPLQHNHAVLELLFELANWHALAKLRMYTDVTLDIFDSASINMYDAMRKFATITCAAFEVYESPAGVEARVRRSRAKNPDAAVDTSTSGGMVESPPQRTEEDLEPDEHAGLRSPPLHEPV